MKSLCRVGKVPQANVSRQDEDASLARNVHTYESLVSFFLSFKILNLKINRFLERSVRNGRYPMTDDFIILQPNYRQQSDRIFRIMKDPMHRNQFQNS